MTEDSSSNMTSRAHSCVHYVEGVNGLSDGRRGVNTSPSVPALPTYRGKQVVGGGGCDRKTGDSAAQVARVEVTWRGGDLERVERHVSRLPSPRPQFIYTRPPRVPPALFLHPPFVCLAKCLKSSRSSRIFPRSLCGTAGRYVQTHHPLP